MDIKTKVQVLQTIMANGNSHTGEDKDRHLSPAAIRYIESCWNMFQGTLKDPPVRPADH